MKKYLFLLAFLMSAVIARSQSVAILDTTGNNISGTTINIPITSGMEAAYSIKIQNLTGDSIGLKITKIYDEGPVDGSDNTMCTPNTTYGSGTCSQSGTMTTATFALAGNEISGKAEMHYDPGVNAGATTIRYKVQNAANATDFAFVTLSFSTNTAVLPKDEVTFSIFPNPATTELRITNYELRNNLVEFFDVTGKHIATLRLYDSTTTINVSQWREGVYFCRFSDNNNVEKIVKLLIKR